MACRFHTVVLTPQDRASPQPRKLRATALRA
jgi:hypothetical protein